MRVLKQTYPKVIVSKILDSRRSNACFKANVSKNIQNAEYPKSPKIKPYPKSKSIQKFVGSIQNHAKVSKNEVSKSIQKYPKSKSIQKDEYPKVSKSIQKLSVQIWK